MAQIRALRAATGPGRFNSICSVHDGSRRARGCKVSGHGGRPVAAWRRASWARSRPGRTLLGLVCPAGALRARQARPDLTGNRMLCGRVRSTNVFVGGGSSLPCGRGYADPDTLYPSPLSCRSVTVSSVRRLWWLRVHGGARWRVVGLVVARPRLHGLLCFRLSGTAERVFSGEILVGSADTDAVPPLVASLLPEGRRGYPSSASLCAGGNPRASALVRAAAVLSFFKVLLGTRRFEARSVVILLRRAQWLRITVV